ncbi:hypothetical protein ALP13_200092 [Pseudomonas syringae pv. maculicola]|uniref:Uncharacterized protein n=1 Tax=Pseudomonas syringae pv. maculicola TaxID=59511 RepID=A0A3M6BWI2_PSEYM|nr:hypothetical protein ALP13_200092 [Pseudomonas syringae pv. maculicola]
MQSCSNDPAAAVSLCLWNGPRAHHDSRPEQADSRSVSELAINGTTLGGAMPPYDVYDSLPKILARFVITCRYICSVTSSIYFVTSCSYYKCQYRVYPK